MYQLFNPLNNQTQLSFVKCQLDIFTACFSAKDQRICILASDFNLDDRERFSLENRYKAIFELQNEVFNTLQLIQLIDFISWHKVINNVLKTSILDHIYVKEPNFVSNITSATPLIGDHKIITYNISSAPESPKVVY